VAEAAGSHRLILIGELHGTQEAPAIVSRLVRQLSATEPVLLALEIHAGEQASIRAYLDSDGRPASRDRLLSRAFWQVPPERNDGRRSWDLVAVIESVRRLRLQGRDVGVLALDASRPGTSDSAARDAAMARRLRAAYGGLPRGRVVALTGNVHAMRARPSFAPPEMQVPMGAHLRDLDPFSVNVSARSGQFRACTATACAARDAMPAAPATGPDTGETFDFQVVLPRFRPGLLITAARPGGPA
jgi:erythromycin esterase-like protein